MPVSLYMDVHVPRAITEQLRLRGVDVLTAQEDRSRTLPDNRLLEHVHTLGRVLFTQDIRFWALAMDCQRQGRAFSGLAYGHQNKGIGPFVDNLELIAKATDPADWRNRVQYLPY